MAGTGPVSTIAPRCILSMGAFCDGFRDRQEGLWVNQSASAAYDTFMQPQKLIPGFVDKEKDAWRIAREWCAENIRPEAFIQRIFGDSLWRLICIFRCHQKIAFRQGTSFFGSGKNNIGRSCYGTLAADVIDFQ